MEHHFLLLWRFFRRAFMLGALSPCLALSASCSLWDGVFGGSGDASAEASLPAESVAGAMRLQMNGEWYKAGLKWAELVSEDGDPDYADGWYNLGYCNDRLGKSQAAIEYYEKALGLSPGNVFFKYSLANTLLAARQNQRAYELMAQVTASGQYYYLGFYGLASAHLALNRPEEALEALNRCISLVESSETWLETPDLEHIYAAKAMTLIKLRREDEALKVLDDMEGLHLPISPQLSGYRAARPEGN